MASDRFGEDVGRAVEQRRLEYDLYARGENADPEAFVERMRELLEEMRQLPEPDAVQVEALQEFLREVEEAEA
ncbi:MAG: hypothetical protein HY875_15690 [Chloroflexi bacterium]|nr:hypothetical protein [Chloroflexota bacterium]